MRNKDCRFKITRIINNNVLTSKDHQNEVVLMGKGIAWNKKVGDVVEEKNIEKIFTLKENEKSRYLDFIEQIDSSFFEMAIEILDESQKETGIEPNPIAYLMLADHISSAVERSKMGINLVNENLNEIKRFHSKEFNVGKAALDKIEAKYDVRLKLDEAGFIAHHLINVLGSTDEETNRNQFIQKIIELVENYFEITLDKESIPYERFLTHLRYFSSRIFSKK
ncbi:PRD domain-containing protein [Clostridium sp. YIM B02515]|uniref:PRD domain-containing protein n=1 Tax=Clostridium rhizosphaerae TaxID=2803861 RepID=A0ABS1T9G1_9CLOT|nr:PRD domain-containing protein [Clostridium rhizosphaerae]MBL4934984.1 PRD domain-containing protein [Clostridium rhizosphaerae]